jgi:hypothetical protein
MVNSADGRKTQESPRNSGFLGDSVQHEPATSKVAASGFEPLATSAEHQSAQSLAASGKTPLAQTLARKTAIDPELARVMDAWPELPARIRAAVLALIGTAG